MRIQSGSIRRCPSCLPAVLLLAASAIRLAGQGGVDAFNPNATGGPVRAIAVQPDGRILVGGSFTSVGGTPRDRLALLETNGSLIASFNPGAGGERVLSIALQTNGQIVAGGAFTTLGGQPRNRLGRLNANGTLDTSFNPGADDWVWTVAMQADGKILAGGTFTNLAGQTRRGLGRLHTDGSLDSGFNPGADAQVNTIVLQPDGKILVGGFFTMLGGQPRPYLGRLNTNGTLDAAFNPAVGNVVWRLALQTDGKILVGGAFNSLGGQSRTNIGRLNADGTLDNTFNSAANSTVNSFAVQADGKIIAGGNFTTLAGQPRAYVGRLNSNGTLDTNFTAQANVTVFSLAAQPDGRILIGGDFTMLGGQPRNRLGRSAVPLSLAEHPQSRRVLLGEPVTFNVTAAGLPPFSYQWRKDGGNISGATNSTYVIPGVRASDGGAYNVSVSNAGGSVTSSNATLDVFLVSNDDFADATVVLGQTNILTGHNTHATQEQDEPEHAFSVGGKSVWWRWTAPWNGSVILDTTGSPFDTLLAVYTGSVVSGLTEIASDDNGASFFPNTASRVVFPCVAGTAYHIAVDGADGVSGAIVLKMEAVPIPINDAFASRLAFTGQSNTVTGHLLGATKEAGEPSDPFGDSVWWTWTAPVTGVALVNTEGSSLVDGFFPTPAGLGVYVGSTVSALTTLSADSGQSTLNPSRVSFPCIAGTAYHIAIKGPSLASGAVVVNLRTGPSLSNDRFASRISIAGTTNTVQGSNVGAGVEAGEPSHGFPGGRSVWWTWTAPANGTLLIDTIGSSFDTLLAVYTNSTLPTLGLVARGFGDQGVSLKFPVSQGVAYQIAVDGGSFRPNGDVVLNLRFVPPPGNDAFAGRFTISGSTNTAFGHNIGATKESGEFNHAGFTGGKSVWWSWTAPANALMSVDTIGSTFDTLLAVYTGSSVSALATTASDADSGNASGASQLTFLAAAGTAYRIAVDGWNGANGSITLNLLHPPANDAFANRATLTGTSNTVPGLNWGATREAGEPLHAGDRGGGSIWWTWTAPGNGTVSLDTFGSSFDTLLAVYRGSAVNNLVAVASNDYGGPGGTSALSFPCTAGTVYQFAVDGLSGARGSVVLNHRFTPPPPAPANDMFAARRLLSGLPVMATGENVSATVEAGEPTHAGFAGGKSVWWTWTAPATRLVRVDTRGSSFDTLLAVYTGSPVSILQFVAADDDGSYPQSLLVFSAVQGTTYQFAVDGKGGESGLVKLNIVPVPANDDVAGAPVISGTSNVLAGTTRGATIESGSFESEASVWWRFDSPVRGLATLSFDESSSLVLFWVYEDSPFVDPNPISSNLKENPPRLECSTSFPVEAGRSYFVGFSAGFKEDEAAFTARLRVTPSPANDFFAARQNIPGTPVHVVGSTVGASVEAGEPAHGFQSVWWTWTPVRTGPVIVTTEGSEADTVLAVYTGNDLNNLVPVACNDDAAVWPTTDAVPFDPISRVRFNALAGTSYQIAVSVARGKAGAVALSFPEVALEQFSLLSRMVLPDRSTDITAGLSIANLRSTPTGPLRISLLSRGGFSFNERYLDSCIYLPQFVAADELLGVSGLPAPGFIAATGSASTIVQGRCSPPYEEENWGLGQGLTAILEEFRAGNWEFVDARLLAVGAWPHIGQIVGPGGGVITVSSALGSFAGKPTYLDVDIGPPAAVRLGAMWRVSPLNFGVAGELWRYTNYRSGPLTFAVYNTNFAVEAKDLAGFIPPSNRQITLSPGATTPLDLIYSVVPPRLFEHRVNGLGITGTPGTAYRIESAPSLPFQTITLLPNPVTLNAGVTFVPGTIPTGTSNQALPRGVAAGMSIGR